MKYQIRLLDSLGLEESSSRSVSIIKFSFPEGLVGYSDIHSQNQLNGVLTLFGRGVVDPKGVVKIGNIGTSHIGLSKGMQDAKRFYFGYSREKETVYIVAKNNMDLSYVRNNDNLKQILSHVFDMFKLSVTAGKKLKFIERKGRPRIPGKILLRKLDVIDDIKEPIKHKTKKHKLKHKRSTP